MRPTKAAVLLLALAALAAPRAHADPGDTWYPAPGWRDEPDPVASPLARKGGTLSLTADIARDPRNATLLYELVR